MFPILKIRFYHTLMAHHSLIHQVRIVTLAVTGVVIIALFSYYIKTLVALCVNLYSDQH